MSIKAAIYAASGPGSPSDSPVQIGADANGNLLMGNLTPGTPLAVSATVSAAANNQALPGTTGKTTYITGFDVTGLGASAAGSIQVTVTGLLGGATLNYTLPIPSGATTGVVPLSKTFSPPLPASGPNVAIVVNVPSFGSGNTVASAAAYGFQL